MLLPMPAQVFKSGALRSASSLLAIVFISLGVCSPALAQPAGEGRWVNLVRRTDNGTMEMVVRIEERGDTHLTVTDRIGRRLKISLMRIESMQPLPGDPKGPCDSAIVRNQIRDLDKAIEALEAVREAKIASAMLDRHLDNAAMSGRECRRAIQVAANHYRNRIRISDRAQRRLEDEFGSDAAGIAYELRQLFSMVEKLKLIREGGFVNSYSHYLGKAYEGLSLANAEMEMIIALADSENMSGGEALKNLGNLVDGLSNGLSLFLTNLNPVIGAMLTVYTKALTVAGEVADDVIAPRTRRVNEAIAAAGDAFGSGTDPETDDEDEATQRLDRAIAALDELIDQLKLRRDELQDCRERALADKADVDIHGAIEVARRTLEIDADRTAELRRDLSQARDRINRLARRLNRQQQQARICAAQMQTMIDRAREDRAALESLAEKLQRVHRMKKRHDSEDALTVIQRHEKTIKQHIAYRSAQMRDYNEGYDRYEQRRRAAREEVESVRSTLREIGSEYRDNRLQFQAYRQAFTRTLRKYADIDEQVRRRIPRRFRDSDYYAVSEEAQRVLADVLNELPPLE